MLNIFLASAAHYVKLIRNMALLTPQKRKAVNILFTTLGTLQRSADLEMVKGATELEIDMRQHYGLPLVRQTDNAEATAAAGKGGGR